MSHKRPSYSYTGHPFTYRTRSISLYTRLEMDKAAIQATSWFPERRLSDKMGSKQTERDNDYEKAFTEYYRAEPGDDGIERARLRATGGARPKTGGTGTGGVLQATPESNAPERAVLSEGETMKLLLILITTVFFTGCMSHNVHLYGTIDQENKTVTVPPGSRGLKGKLKKLLSQNGWQLAVYSGPSVTEGKLGEKTKIKQYDTFNTKYRLIVSSRKYDICFNLSPAIKYDISFINNHSGSEIFTIDGNGCESGVIKKFENALNGIE